MGSRPGGGWVAGKWMDGGVGITEATEEHEGTEGAFQCPQRFQILSDSRALPMALGGEGVSADLGGGEWKEPLGYNAAQGLPI